MSKAPSPPSGVGWFTGFGLSLVIFLCLAAIGFSGYLKYQLDRAEAVLAAPESALAADQDAAIKLRRTLGYSGFVGAAQNFVTTRDAAAINDMKAQLKTARDIQGQLPEKTPAEARRDLQSILDIFASAAQKAEQSTTDTSVGFTASDMAPLFAALPVLDQRTESAMASGRFAAQGNVKLWATLLTIITWISLITAAACASGIYLSLRGRHAAPLRALAQSVQNMARGDMRTPVWGMERQDIVGDLARSVDLARYHFSQLPDMSLLSEQGPMRIRFEGKARSLFEAMMQNITRDSEGIRAQASSLAASVNQQKEATALVSSRIETALGDIQEEQQTKELQIQQLLNSVVGSAQSLHGAQQAAEVQLNHLIAYLEERARGMAEVTQIAGRQVAQTLQSLTTTEHTLRSSAEQNQDTVRKLAASTDELGERLFGAVSLLRAGGKVLTETAEATQTRLNEAIGLLSQSEGSLRQMLVQGFEPVGQPTMQMPGQDITLEPNLETERLQSIVAGLENAQRKLEECLSQQSEATQAQIQLLTSHSQSLLTQASTTAQTLATITDNLREEQGRLGESINQTGGRFAEVLDNIGGRLEQRVMESLNRAEAAMPGIDRLSELGDQMGAVVQKLTAQASTAAENTNDSLLMEIKSGFEVTTRSISRLREEFIGAALNGPSVAPAAAASSAPAAPIQWEPIIQQIMAANDSLANVITRQTDRIETRIAVLDKKMATGVSPDEAQAQLRQQAQVLSELAGALGAIDAHMQEMSAKFKNQNQPQSMPNNGRMAS